MELLTFFNKHLFWAYRNWVEENTGRAHIVIKEQNIKDEYLKKYVRNGNLVLNVSSTAAEDLVTEEFSFTFIARFGETPRKVTIQYNDLEGFVSPLDGGLMPFDVIPILSEEGPALAIVKPVLPQIQTTTSVNETSNIVNNSKVVNLADRRTSKPKSTKDK